MGRRTSGIAVAGILSLGLLSPPWVAHSGAASTVTRFASPDGSGTSCTQASPCDILRAVSSAPDGAEVIIEPGQYGSRISPIPDQIASTAANLVIHGQADKAPPVIFSSGSIGVRLNSDSLDHVSIIYSGEGLGLVLADSSTADHVRVQSDAVACFIDTGSLYNSLCTTTGSDAVLTIATSATKSSTLRNVTAVGSGSASTGVECDADSGGSCAMSLVNTIAVGNAGGFDARAHADSGGSAVITAFNSELNKVGQGGEPSGTTAVHTDDSDITDHPTFVDATNGDFHEAATSPTIDAGLTDGAEGATDLDGLPRVLGTAADIGAYEFPSRPAVSNVQVTKSGKHSIHLTAVVNTTGLPAAVQVAAHHHNTSITSDPKAVAAKGGATTVKLVAAQLKPHTKYKIEVTVTDAGGAASATSTGARTRG